MKRSKSPASRCARCAKLEVESRQVHADADAQCSQLEAVQRTLRRTQAELEALRRQYADLHETPVGCVILDGNGCIRQADAAARRMLADGGRDVQGLPLRDFVRQEDRKAFQHHLTQLRRGTTEVVTELGLDRESDGVLSVQLRSEPVPVTQRPSRGKRFQTLLADMSDRGEVGEELAAERRRSEEAWRAAALFPEQNAAPVLRVSYDGRLLYANPASAPLLQSWGYQKGRTIPDEIGARVRTALDTDRATEVESVCGEILYLFSIAPIVSDGYANLYGRDITERRRVEEENQRNEARLESLLRISQRHADSMAELLDFALDEAIALTGSKMGYVCHYDEAKKELTLNSWSINAMKACRTTRPQTVYQLDQAGIWGEAVRQRTPIVVNDFQSPHPSKRGYPPGYGPVFKYMTVPVFSEGHIVGAIGVANKETDYDDSDVRQLTLLMDSVWKIVERKKAEQALRESEERYRCLFSEMTEGFSLHEIICDAHGKPCDYRFLQVNPAFEQLTGLKRQDVEGHLCSEVLPDEADHWVSVFGPVALDGHSVHFDSRMSGIGRYHEVFAYCPAPGQFAVLFLDISERRQAEQALRAANEQLQEQAEALQRQTVELTATNEELHKNERRLVAQAEELEAARAAAENERLRLEAVMEALPVGVAIADVQGAHIRTNAAYERLWGGPVPPVRSARDHAAYKAWWAETGKPVPPKQWASTQAVCKGKSVVDQLLEIERFDGSRAFVLNSASPIRDARGKVVGSAAAVQDITDLRQAQEAIRDSEQRLRLALEGGRMVYWEHDFQENVSVWSHSLYAMLGLDPAQTLASTEALYERVHHEDKAVLERLVREAIDCGTDFRAEFRIVRPDGQVAWLTSRAKVIRDEEGRAGRMMGVIYDISDRKEMEDELRRLNEHLEQQVESRTEELAGTVELLRDEVALRKNAEQALHQRSRILEGFFQHTITPLAFMDKQFNFVRVNDAYAQADKTSPDTLVGKNHFELFPDEKTRAIFEQVARTKQPYHAYAKPFSYFRTPQRGTTYWNWLLTPLLGETGDVEFLVLNLEDVTERQLAFEELEKRASQLQRLTLELSQAEDHERQRLAEVLHDDLQQLLVGAKLHLNILANRTGDDEELNDVVGQVRKLITESINRSRGLSHELSPPLLQQGGLSEALAWLAQQMLSTCGLTVQVDTRPGADVRSEALRTFVYKAVQEMLFNVVKHARVKRARVELRRLSGYVRLVVSDEGQGFDSQRLAQGSGAGFGLFSIQERVRLLGGWMKFKSTPGKGSVFVLAIPDSAESGAVTATPEVAGADEVLRPPGRIAAGRQAEGQCIRVLLVDDHKVMRQGIAALLDEEPDIEVVGQAGNGRDAVTLAEQLQPDVIVMDVAMPVLSGDDATRQIKVQMPATRIIGLSISEPGSVSDRILQAGAELFLSKTDPSEKLLAAIRGLDWHG